MFRIPDHPPSDMVTVVRQKRELTAPHCDASILHAPGECTYCDDRPEWQEYRQVAGIAFTGQTAGDGLAPCPSTWFRSPATRDQWFGNTPVIEEDPV